MSGVVCVDFDGVIHPTGRGRELIPDMSVAPTPGVEGFLASLVTRGFEVVVFSSRATVREGQIGIKTYLRRWKLDSYVSDITATKIPAVAYVDNRAVHYIDQNWQECIQQILTLKVHGG